VSVTATLLEFKDVNDVFSVKVISSTFTYYVPVSLSMQGNGTAPPER